MDYKLIEYDGNSPDFIGRERKRYAVMQAQEAFESSNKLEDELAYFDAMVDFLLEYVEAPREELEGLSLNDLMALYMEVIGHVLNKESADPKDFENTEDG